MFSNLRWPFAAALALYSSMAIADTSVPSVEELTESFDNSYGFHMDINRASPDRPNSINGFSAIFQINPDPQPTELSGRGPFSLCEDTQRAGPLLSNLLSALEQTTNPLIDKSEARSAIQETIDLCFDENKDPSAEELALTC